MIFNQACKIANNLYNYNYYCYTVNIIIIIIILLWSWKMESILNCSNREVEGSNDSEAAAPVLYHSKIVTQ